MSGNPDSFRKAVMEMIENDRDELVQLCLLLGRTPSAHGHEMQIAKLVVDWMNTNKIDSTLQRITDESANAVGVMRGTGGGKSLIFDAHIDINEGSVGEGEEARRMETGFTDGDLIYGYSIVNDKAQAASFMIAARAIKKAGIKLRGDLVIAAVSHETGPKSIDEYSGIESPGSGFGSRWLIDRGVVADYALVGETSGYGIVSVECGEVMLKITVKGKKTYTPRLIRRGEWQKNPNSYVKASHVALALEDWAIKYEGRNRLEFDGGIIIPKCQILGMRGSEKCGTQGRDCYIYFDVYILPEANPMQVQKEVQELVAGLGVEASVSVLGWSRGHFARGAEPLIKAVRDAHRYVVGSETLRVQSEDVSMWRDLNAFNEVGIPSICYGPPRQKEAYTDAENRAIRIADLLNATKVYALTAMEVCGVQS